MPSENGLHKPHLIVTSNKGESYYLSYTKLYKHFRVLGCVAGSTYFLVVKLFPYDI